MTDIRKLLQDTVDDQSLQPISTDPLPELNRAARRRKAGAAFTSVAVAIAAVFVLLLLVFPSGDSGRARTYDGDTPSPKPPATVGESIKTWNVGGPVHGVAVGLGFVWLNRGGFVEQTTLAGKAVHTFTGQDISRVTGIAVGAGRVWVLGPSGGRMRLTAYNPTSRTEDSRVLPRGAAKTFGSTATWNGAFWVVQPLLNAAIAFSPQTAAAVSTVSMSGRPEYITETGTGQLWVEHDHFSKLTQIVDNRNDFPSPSQTYGQGRTFAWDQPIFAPAPSNALWTTDGSRLIGLTPSALRVGDSVAQGYRLQGHGKPLEVSDGTNGVFVDSLRGVDFWSDHDIRHAYKPTSYYKLLDIQTAGAGPQPTPNFVSDIAADGDGVLINDTDGSVTLWTPRS